MNESCFSAVMPVIGWNQWVKWVAPLEIAQSFMAFATTGSSAVPWVMVLLSALKTSFGRRSFMTASLNTMLPNISGTLLMFLPPDEIDMILHPLLCFGAACTVQAKEKGAAGHVS